MGEQHPRRSRAGSGRDFTARRAIGGGRSPDRRLVADLDSGARGDGYDQSFPKDRPERHAHHTGRGLNFCVQCQG